MSIDLFPVGLKMDVTYPASLETAAMKRSIELLGREVAPITRSATSETLHEGQCETHPAWPGPRRKR